MPTLTVYDSYVLLENFDLPLWICFSFCEDGVYIGPKKDTLYYENYNVIMSDDKVYSPDIVYEFKKRGIKEASFILFNGVYFIMP